MNRNEQKILQELSTKAKEKLNNQEKEKNNKKNEEIEENPEELYNYDKFYDDDDDTKKEVYEEFEKINKVKDIGSLENVEYKKSLTQPLNNINYDDIEKQSIDEIYPGGPSEYLVNLWKNKYPKARVFSIEVSGQSFVCRSLGRLEYKKLVSLYDLDQLQREELICATCVLYPQDFDWQDVNNLRGGIPSTLAAIIMEHSGFTQNYKVYIL